MGEHSSDDEQEQFAVKLARSNDQEVLDAHEREYAIIKDLDHPNVIKGFELFKDDLKNEVHLVLRFVRGVELLDQISK